MVSGAAHGQFDHACRHRPPQSFQIPRGETCVAAEFDDFRIDQMVDRPGFVDCHVAEGGDDNGAAPGLGHRAQQRGLRDHALDDESGAFLAQQRG